MILLLSLLLYAEEGLWPVDSLVDNPHFPQELHKTVQIFSQPNTTAYQSLVSLENCTGILISEHGLVLSSAQCFPNLNRSFFYAETPRDEIALPSEGPARVITEVTDISTDVYRGISTNAMPDYVSYRKARNQRYALQQCRKHFPSAQCTIHYRPQSNQFYLLRSEPLTDLRIVLLTGEPYDLIMFRLYQEGKPLSTPSHLKLPQESLPPPKSLVVVGYPQVSDRYLHPTEWTHMRDIIYDYPRNISQSWTYILQQYSSQRAQLLHRLLFRLTSAHTSLRNIFTERAPYETQLQKSDSSPQYLTLVEQLQHNTHKTIYLKWLTLSSELLYSAQKRYIWQYNRARPDESRAPGFQNKDKSKMILHLDGLEQRVDTALEKQLLCHMLEQPPIEELKEWLTSKGGAKSLCVDLFDQIDVLFDVTDALSLLDKPYQPDIYRQNIWLELGAFTEELRKTYQQQKLMLHKEKTRIHQQFLSRQNHSTYYPNADGSLRVSWGKVQNLESLWERIAQTLSIYPPLVQWLKTTSYFVSNADIADGSIGSAGFDAQGHWNSMIYGGNDTSQAKRWFYHPQKTQTYHITTASILALLKKDVRLIPLLEECQ